MRRRCARPPCLPGLGGGVREGWSAKGREGGRADDGKWSGNGGENRNNNGQVMVSKKVKWKIDVVIAEGLLG